MQSLTQMLKPKNCMVARSATMQFFGFNGYRCQIKANKLSCGAKRHNSTYWLYVLTRLATAIIFLSQSAKKQT